MKKAIATVSRLPERYVSFYVSRGKVIETEFESMMPFPKGPASQVTCLANDSANRERLRRFHGDRLARIAVGIPEIVAPAPVSKPVIVTPAVNASLRKFSRPPIPLPKRP